MAVLSFADSIGAFSAFVAAIAAGGAAYTAYVTHKTLKAQVSAEKDRRAIEKEEQAAATVKRYLELCIAYPKLSTAGGKQTEQQLYEWFVSFILIMVQDVLLAHPNDQQWRKLMRDQLTFNANELRAWKKDKYDFSLFGSNVAGLVDEVLKESKAA